MTEQQMSKEQKIESHIKKLGYQIIEEDGGHILYESLHKKRRILICKAPVIDKSTGIISGFATFIRAYNHSVESESGWEETEITLAESTWFGMKAEIMGHKNSEYH